MMELPKRAWAFKPFTNVVVYLTEKEGNTLSYLSDKMDLPQNRVMVQALRLYEMVHEGYLKVEETNPLHKSVELKNDG